MSSAIVRSGDSRTPTVEALTGKWRRSTVATQAAAALGARSLRAAAPGVAIAND